MLCALRFGGGWRKGGGRKRKARSGPEDIVRHLHLLFQLLDALTTFTEYCVAKPATMIRKRSAKARSRHLVATSSETYSTTTTTTEKQHEAQGGSRAPVTEAQNEAPFRLLDLPNELLLPILDMAVTVSCKGNPIRIHYAVRSKKSNVASPAGEIKYRKGAHMLMQPAITRVCRLLRNEGLPMFYKQNTFYSWHNRYSFRAVRRWLDDIGQVHASNMMQLFIDRSRSSTDDSTECTCMLAEVLHDLRAALNGMTYNLVMRVRSGKIVLDCVAGVAVVQVKLKGVREDWQDEAWGSAKGWIQKLKPSCFPLSEYAAVV